MGFTDQIDNIMRPSGSPNSSFWIPSNPNQPAATVPHSQWIEVEMENNPIFPACGTEQLLGVKKYHASNLEFFQYLWGWKNPSFTSKWNVGTVVKATIYMPLLLPYQDQLMQTENVQNETW